MQPFSPLPEAPESFERKRETAGGLMGVEGAERMGWGPILGLKKRDVGCFLRFEESDFWHLSPKLISSRFLCLLHCKS